MLPKDLFIYKNIMKYPTDWFGGKPRGSIGIHKNKNNESWFVKVSGKDGKIASKYFLFNDDDEKEEQLKLAEKWKKDKSDELGLTINRIRYIDKNIIEVEITQGKTFKTNAEHIDKVGLYKLSTKVKKEKNNNERYYVLCMKNKKAFNFTDLICDYKIVQYIDGNTLNLTNKNLKEFGNVDIKINNKSDKKDYEIDQYSIFKLDTSILPKDVWILGKPAGTVFKRKNDDIYTARVTDDNNKQHAKTFKISEYDSDNDAKIDALKWQYATSYKLGMTKNMIKILDNEYIEVALTKDCTMITDKVFIPLIQKIPLFVSTAGKTNNKNPEKYSLTIIKEKLIRFHGLITGFKMVDHINRNTMDNRLINLRFCDHSENGRNKTTDSEITGVKFYDDGSRSRYETRGKFFGMQLCKQFYVKKFKDKDEAKEYAKIFRENMYEFNVNSDNVLLTGYENIEDFVLFKKYNNILLNDLKSNIVYDFDKYLEEINLDKKR